MNEEQFQQIQNITLEILDEIIRICRKNNIHFVMMGGSCLGAIRHQGMIPWDDDIDLGMYREDYNRFIQICESELDKKYFFQHMDSEYYSGFIFGKIRKNNTILMEEYAKDMKMNHGIWVDVFPFDYVDDDIKKHQRRYSSLLFYRNLFAVKQKFNVKKQASLVIKISFYISKTFVWLVPRNYLVNKLKNIMEALNKEKTNTLFPYGCAWGLKERISKDEFFDTIDVEFNNRKVPVFRSYEAYLRRLYGDYMTPPPKAERIKGHDVYKLKID